MSSIGRGEASSNRTSSTPGQGPAAPGRKEQHMAEFHRSRGDRHRRSVGHRRRDRTAPSRGRRAGGRAGCQPFPRRPQPVRRCSGWDRRRVGSRRSGSGGRAIRPYRHAHQQRRHRRTRGCHGELRRRVAPRVECRCRRAGPAPDEVAGAVAYLASPGARSATGTPIAVNGGNQDLRLPPRRL